MAYNLKYHRPEGCAVCSIQHSSSVFRRWYEVLPEEDYCRIFKLQTLDGRRGYICNPCVLYMKRAIQSLDNPSKSQLQNPPDHTKVSEGGNEWVWCQCSFCWFFIDGMKENRPFGQKLTGLSLILSFGYCYSEFPRQNKQTNKKDFTVVTVVILLSFSATWLQAAEGPPQSSHCWHLAAGLGGCSRSDSDREGTWVQRQEHEVPIALCLHRQTVCEVTEQ